MNHKRFSATLFGASYIRDFTVTLLVGHESSGRTRSIPWWNCHVMRRQVFSNNGIDYWLTRARRFPLPDSPGQVKLPVGQVDLDRFFFFISYKQIKEFQNSWSRASDDFEKRRALLTTMQDKHVPWGTISTTFAISVFRSNRKCKYAD